MKRRVDPQWYKKIWELDVQDASWVEPTKQEVAFIVDILQLRGDERVLDLACGFGRHALELADRGHSVVGVDITSEYIDRARELAHERCLAVEFMCADLREVSFREEFDVVLNLADGAIGYLENEEEDLKVFDLIASALKPGGKHVMAVCNADHARKHFPRRHWEAGSRSISLAEFDWDEQKCRMLYWGHMLKYGEPLTKPETGGHASSIRLYPLEELRGILDGHGMEIRQAYGAYDASVPASDDQLTLLVYSEKVVR